MAKPKLTVFLDVISPFAYMAFYVTKNSPAFQQCDVTYVPLFLGGVFKATGNRAPLEVKNKDIWINIERQRWAKTFRIPIAVDPPSPFPQPTIKTQRALCALQLAAPEKLPAAFEALYQAFWVEKRTIDKVFAEVLTEALGKELGEKVVEGAGGPEAKKLLQENSDLAMKEGAFGVPWFVATNAEGKKESFWGFDHMGQVLEHLGVDRGTDQNFRSML